MYFVFGYVETALTPCVALSSATPLGLKGLTGPVAASSGAAVAGAIFWNAYDEANMNSMVYDAKNELVVVNTHATDSVLLTIKTKNYTANGLDYVVEDYVTTIPPLSIFFSGILSSAFNDSAKVKILIADVSAGDALADVFLAVVKRS